MKTLHSYGTGSGHSEYLCGKVEDILQKAISEILGKFYEENKGKIIIYSPVDHIDYYNTISEGWYLFKANGKFTLQCGYRVAEVV